MVAKGDKDGSERVLASNRAASHEFQLLKRFEAGVVLTGPEVKTARAGRVNLRDGYARIKHGEVLLFGVHFSPYAHARAEAQNPLRVRKLLLHAREIRKLERETQSSGTTLVPTKLYLKQGRIKIEIALARAKRLFDKRESAKKKIQQREMARGRE
ncbi:MAG TPA: SsrA-binding protein SmpB [Candidatus Polarisedimenticolaceae bacterium]|nr:SsrA-binding protein SmpB [Candidatus Polarisedimenticolaceae bacterium]